MNKRDIHSAYGAGGIHNFYARPRLKHGWTKALLRWKARITRRARARAKALVYASQREDQ